MRGVGYRAGVAAPVSVGGRLWGVLAAATTSEEPLPDGLEQRLCDFADLVAQALANADAYEKLAASRARVVEVGDAERRRLERNLHDGAQQRLVSVALGLSVVGAQARERPGSRTGDPVRGTGGSRRGLAELRELARGIHPAVLTERGLGPGAALAARARARPGRDRRAARGAPGPDRRGGGLLRRRRGDHERRQVRASVARDRRRRAARNAPATVTVCDDGVGGADPAHGSGLHGLAARVESLNGRLDVDSPPGRGTRITAEIPLP